MQRNLWVTYNEVLSAELPSPTDGRDALLYEGLRRCRRRYDCDENDERGSCGRTGCACGSECEEDAEEVSDEGE
jgi:hypothetical protein